MKKIYEKPMVELTKFDVEDIITASGTPTVIDSSASAESKNAAETAVTGLGTYDAVGVYNW